MKITMPKNAKMILDTIHRAGFEAYVVGGCVRDALLGREPGDWDITTNALPQDIKKLFRRTIDTGIQHGTVTVMVDKEGYEVTTYRIDGKYEDSRHPSEVTFTKNLTEDMKRRDFTINAMAYNEEEGLIDRFGGIEDLNNRIIRCVGDPMERFSEDALRIMRAVRFSAQLDYSIEDATRAAIKELAPTLEKISAERIQVELVKLLTSPHPDRIRDAYEMGVTAVILPELDRCMVTEQNNPHHMYSVGEHIIQSLLYVPDDKVLRLTMLFHDLAKPLVETVDEEGISHFYKHAVKGADLARGIFKRLKFDRDTMDLVCKLVLHHDDRFPAEEKYVRRAMNRVGKQELDLLLKVRYADTMAQSDYARQDNLDLIEQTRKVYESVLQDNQCVDLKSLAVNGGDLIAKGVAPGKMLGSILEVMLEEVLDDPAHNDREYLLGDLDRFQEAAKQRIESV
jgi:tRNA nucleotidyltransferase (CCA-adding enzyme)